MLKTAYEIGLRQALDEAGLTKEAQGALRRLLTHPATIGATMGGLGSLLAGGDEPSWERTLRGGGAGAAVGLGVRTLPKYLKKIPGMTTATGELAQGAGDLAWMAPSFLAVPAIMSAGQDENKAGHTAKHRARFRGKW
jgi:hypothetical protein